MIGKTYNFVEYPSGQEPVVNMETAQQLRDIRNGIMCINPTCDLECYLNYIKLLNLHRSEWVAPYGYLDMGMIPLVMGPSFINEGLYAKLVGKLGKYNIKAYDMPAVSLMYSACKIPIQDVWVFKQDVSEVLNIPVEKMTAEILIRWCWII